MDDQPHVALPVSETLPEQYRAVLDRVANLEASGRRHEADEVRRAAIKAYSRVWTARTAHRLVELASRADRLMTVAPMPRRRSRLTLAWLRPRTSLSPAPTVGAPSTETPLG